MSLASYEGIFGVCIVYLALACGLIHVFLCAVTTGSEIRRFYFQARMLIVHITLKSHNEKLTLQNKYACLNFVVPFLLFKTEKTKNKKNPNSVHQFCFSF